MMTKTQKTRLFAALFLALALSAQGLAQSPGSSPSDQCENAKSKAQSGSLDDFEILARAEKRAEKLRDQLLDVQMQEINSRCRLDDLDYQLTTESIQTAIMFVGSTRPMDELRNELRQRLEAEKARVNTQLELLASRRERLEAAIRRADEEIERLRQQLTLE